jgi:hypothetical protein
MSGDEILRKYVSRSAGAGQEGDADSDLDGTEDLFAFGWLRGARDRAIALEMRKKDGHILAINYSWIERFEFEPSEGITLHAGGQKIYMRGRNLNAEVRPNLRLFTGLCRHRVAWVLEADRPAKLRADGTATVIEQIEW